MIIEIRGAQLVNKGAELMLLSVIQELKKRIHGEIKFVVEPHINMPYKGRVELGLYAIPRYRKYRINWGRAFNYLPKSIHDQLGLITEEEVDVVIDISGFRYGDYWGYRNVVGGLTSYLNKWKKNGVKVLLLPQAFGPFEGKNISIEMRKIIEFADFIAARDSVSYNHLKNIITKQKNNNLFLYPDFTPSITVDSNIYDEYSNHIFIIPNTKMNVNSNYKNYLKSLIVYFSDNGKKFSILIHEGIDDFNLAKEVVKEAQREVNIIWENDPLLVKKLIKSSKYIITSRFHGLINGLSQGIPSLSTSWSHKYETLMSEYEFESGLISDISDMSDTIKKIEFLERNYIKIRHNIESKAKIHKEKVNEMWDDIVKIIEV
jgi:polysaccharide pyruvyl transferase WcaK-like protein